MNHALLASSTCKWVIFLKKQCNLEETVEVVGKPLNQFLAIIRSTFKLNDCLKFIYKDIYLPTKCSVKEREEREKKKRIYFALLFECIFDR